MNNRFTIPVCAVNEKGIKTNYSEIGATLVVCAPSKGVNSDSGITTTDITGEKGYNPTLFPNDYENKNYTKNFGGTSASAPIVSGVVALILDANPNFSWRDVKSILAHSAKIIDNNHADWSINGAGLKINHYYGFGLIDADKSINIAENWNNYTLEEIIEKEVIINLSIPDNDMSGIISEIKIDDNLIIEFVDIFFDTPDHTKIGDLEIILISPAGTNSILAEQHTELFDGAFRYNNWRFGSMRCLEENTKGIWKLIVRDKAQGNIGIFKSWKLKIYGHKEA